MPIDIQHQDGPSALAEALRKAILEAIPEARVDVSPGGTAHFEIRVEAGIFEGMGRVAQQQLVYGAIAPMMSGSNPPVHAIDRLECVVG